MHTIHALRYCPQEIIETYLGRKFTVTIKPYFMQRYNIFRQVHKGLRAMLYETAIAVQQTDFTNEQETEQLMRVISDVIFLFEKHAHSEDTFILPAISNYEPSVVDTFEQEHDKDHALGERLKVYLQILDSVSSAEERINAGSGLTLSFVEFVIFNLDHMAKEESLLNNILWRHYSDEEILNFERSIIANVEPASMAIFSKWMMRGMNNNEIVTWLRKAEQAAPEPVFQALFKTAEQELSEKRFRQVLEGLSEGTMTA